MAGSDEHPIQRGRRCLILLEFMPSLSCITWEMPQPPYLGCSWPCKGCMTLQRDRKPQFKLPRLVFIFFLLLGLCCTYHSAQSHSRGGTSLLSLWDGINVTDAVTSVYTRNRVFSRNSLLHCEPVTELSPQTVCLISIQYFSIAFCSGNVSSLSHSFILFPHLIFCRNWGYLPSPTLKTFCIRSCITFLV